MDSLKFLALFMVVGYVLPILGILVANYIILLEMKYNHDERERGRGDYPILIEDVVNTPFDNKMMLAPVLNLGLLLLMIVTALIETVDFVRSWIAPCFRAAVPNRLKFRARRIQGGISARISEIVGRTMNTRIG